MPPLPTAPEPAEPRQSLRERARAALTDLTEDERVRTYLEKDEVKKYVDKTKQVAERTAVASASLTKKVAQEDSWTELRGAVEDLTEIARSHHALILDLREQIATLEGRLGGAQPGPLK